MKIVDITSDGGAALCTTCGGRLDHSWIVTYSDNHAENRCSLHLADHDPN